MSWCFLFMMELPHWNVMTTKYCIKVIPHQECRLWQRLFQFIMWNTETVPVHFVKYRDYSSYKWFSDSNDFLLLSFLCVKISLWIDSNHCQEFFLYMYISINFCLLWCIVNASYFNFLWALVYIVVIVLVSMKNSLPLS